MERYISAFAHGDEFVSIYYYKAGSLLADLISTVKAHRLLTIDVSEIPSYVIFEQMQNEADRLSREHTDYQCMVNYFREGFSFIVPRSYSASLLDGLLNMPAVGKEGYEFEASQEGHATQRASDISA